MKETVKLPFRGYASLEEAAEIFSMAFEKNVEMADVLMLCLQGEISPRVKIKNSVKFRKVQKVSPDDIPVVISKPGYEFFHDNPSWEPLDDIAKHVSGKKSLPEIKTENPDLFQAISDGKYKTKQVQVVRMRDGFGLPVGELYFLHPVPQAISQFGEGRLWIQDMWKSLSRGEDESIRESYRVMVENQEGDILCPMERVSRGGGSTLSVLKQREWRARGDHEYRESAVYTEFMELVFLNEDIAFAIDKYADISVEREEEDHKTMEVLGLLVELYAEQHGPDYRHGDRPKALRIAEDMADFVPDDVKGMGVRKLQDYLSPAITAWEAKKRR